MSGFYRRLENMKKKFPKPSITNENKLQQAIGFHQQGQLEQAVALYQAILKTQSQHADALHFLGVIAAQRGQTQVAIDLISQSININPNNSAAYSNICPAFKALKRYDEALASYDLAVAIKPDYAEAHHNKSLCQLLLGDFTNGWRNYHGGGKAISFVSLIAHLHSHYG